MNTTELPSGPVERIVSLQPIAWVYQVRFNGEDGREPTDWRNYGVYLNKSDADRWKRHAGDGLGCRVVPLYACDAPQAALTARIILDKCRAWPDRFRLSDADIERLEGIANPGEPKCCA